VYAGYPSRRLAAARVRPHRESPGGHRADGDHRRGAHNEEACIEARIENLLALDYPADRGRSS
jgi:hypothetical protein